MYLNLTLMDARLQEFNDTRRRRGHDVDQAIVRKR
jgi:hypothetical protein